MNPKKPSECPFPNPPVYYLNYTSKRVADGLTPAPPMVPPRYRVFGEDINSKKVKILLSLRKFCQPQLYERPRTMPEIKYELKKFNRSIMVGFLDLTQILIENPESAERLEKLDQIRLLFINFHHLINELRPIQARCIIDATQKNHLLKLVTTLDGIRASMDAANATLIAGREFAKDHWILPLPRKTEPYDEDALVDHFKHVEFPKDFEDVNENPLIEIVKEELETSDIEADNNKYMLEHWKNVPTKSSSMDESGSEEVSESENSEYDSASESVTDSDVEDETASDEASEVDIKYASDNDIEVDSDNSNSVNSEVSEDSGESDSDDSGDYGSSYAEDESGDSVMEVDTHDLGTYDTIYKDAYGRISRTLTSSDETNSDEEDVSGNDSEESNLLDSSSPSSEESSESDNNARSSGGSDVYVSDESVSEFDSENDVSGEYSTESDAKMLSSNDEDEVSGSSDECSDETASNSELSQDEHGDDNEDVEMESVDEIAGPDLVQKCVSEEDRGQDILLDSESFANEEQDILCNTKSFEVAKVTPTAEMPVAEQSGSATVLEAIKSSDKEIPTFSVVTGDFESVSKVGPSSTEAMDVDVEMQSTDDLSSTNPAEFEEKLSCSGESDESDSSQSDDFEESESQNSYESVDVEDGSVSCESDFNEYESDSCDALADDQEEAKFESDLETEDEAEDDDQEDESDEDIEPDMYDEIPVKEEKLLQLPGFHRQLLNLNRNPKRTNFSGDEAVLKVIYKKKQRHSEKPIKKPKSVLNSVAFQEYMALHGVDENDETATIELLREQFIAEGGASSGDSVKSLSSGSELDNSKDSETEMKSDFEEEPTHIELTVPVMEEHDGVLDEIIEKKSIPVSPDSSDLSSDDSDDELVILESICETTGMIPKPKDFEGSSNEDDNESDESESDAEHEDDDDSDNSDSDDGVIDESCESEYEDSDDDASDAESDDSNPEGSGSGSDAFTLVQPSTKEDDDQDITMESVYDNDQAPSPGKQESKKEGFGALQEKHPDLSPEAKVQGSLSSSTEEQSFVLPESFRGNEIIEEELFLGSSDDEASCEDINEAQANALLADEPPADNPEPQQHRDQQ